MVLLKLNLPFKVGDLVEIRGAKVYSKKYGLVFVARSIKDLKGKQEILLRKLRGPFCEPLWAPQGYRGGH